MYNNILIPVDPDYMGNFDALVQLALRLVSDDGTISTLYVNRNYIHNRIAAQSPEFAKDIERAIVEQLVSHFEQAVPEAHRGKVYNQRGVVHDEILRIARRTRVDLIIMAPNKRPWEDFFLGSTTRRVVAEARCSVLIER